MVGLTIVAELSGAVVGCIIWWLSLRCRMSVPDPCGLRILGLRLSWLRAVPFHRSGMHGRGAMDTI